jgi:hypothetical protein
MSQRSHGPELSLSLCGDNDGYQVQLELRGQIREIGRVLPSGDPSFPWLTSAGQLEADLMVAALKLAAHVLEDEQLSLAVQLR